MQQLPLAEYRAGDMQLFITVSAPWEHNITAWMAALASNSKVYITKTENILKVKKEDFLDKVGWEHLHYVRVQETRSAPFASTQKIALLRGAELDTRGISSSPALEHQAPLLLRGWSPWQQQWGGV